MKINSEKSKEIIISYTHGNVGHDVPNILIEGKVVERVDHVKLLGITLSNDLTWKRHVDNIVKKAGKIIYMLYQLKRAGVNQADLVTIYISVVRPVVEYACPVWHTNLPIYLSDNIQSINQSKKLFHINYNQVQHIQAIKGVMWKGESRSVILIKHFPQS